MKPTSGAVPAIAEDQWAGLTLDELRQRRARALVRREVERVKMDHVLQGARTFWDSD